MTAARLPTTVAGLVNRGTRLFRQANLVYGHGLPGAREEAQFLALHALRLAPVAAAAKGAVTPTQAARVLALYDRRIRERIPAAYLVREAWLGSQRFYVDQRVLVPRSYIAELLSDAEEPSLPPANAVRNALDLCTGSGCLAVLLARRYRKAMVDATDISRDALAVAHINVHRRRLQGRLNLLISNYFSALRGRRYDLIVSNPPYVRSAVMRTLPREYRSEPALALAAGRDGLDALRVILAQAARHLHPGGVLVVECGHARGRVERAWPRLPFLWLETSGGDDCVFLLTREDLLQGQSVATTPKIEAPSRRVPRNQQ